MKPVPRLAKFTLVMACTLFGYMTGLRAERETRLLVDGWKFARWDAGLEAATGTWEQVAIPHTWNARDGQTPDPVRPGGYYRGGAWYAVPLGLPALAPGRRVFVRFQAVATVADVYVNDQWVGEHRGAFGAFCFEITRFLRGGDVLKVRADNSMTEEVAPLDGDFAVFGGIYRPVEIIVTDAVCISPLDHGAPGCYLTLQQLDAAGARVGVRALVSNALPVAAPVELRIFALDGAGREVAREDVSLTVPAEAVTPLDHQVVIAQPHLWTGRRDPYLYRFVVTVVRGGETTDTVTQSFGLRTIALTPDRGLLLNGEPYPVRGVTRHQDRLDKGWALAPEDHEEDHALIMEMGATAVRLAHYQQSDYFLGLCDRSGLLVWEEIPLVNRTNALPAFAANAREQLREMILQGHNHPAIFCWGLFNELEATWADKPSAPPDALIRTLRDEAATLDPTRPSVAASWMMTPSSLHLIPDWIAFNIYPGWYWGVPEDFSPTVEKLSRQLDRKRIAISEYGAGASIRQHTEGSPVAPQAGSKFHPEEWQNHVHEVIWAAAQRNPHLWGTFLWTMFDFAVPARDEGDTPGRNDKGLVTYDRKTRKDAFYFYKANWSDEPVLYITSRRATPRTRPVTEVKVYTNLPEVELLVNGRVLGRRRPDAIHVCRWTDVTLTLGANRIECVSTGLPNALRDACEWELTGDHRPPRN